MKLYRLVVHVTKFSTKSELLAVLSCSPLSPSNLRISIIQQSWYLAIASTELCELVSSCKASEFRGRIRTEA